MSKRNEVRFVRRLETEFSAEGKKYRGISSDLSLNGLFIRTNHPFKPGVNVDILIHLPDGSESRLKGVVRRAMKTSVSVLKNGMGIKLAEKDAAYTNFVGSFIDDKQAEQADGPGPSAPSGTSEGPAEAAPAFLIISCGACGVKNKVSSNRLKEGPKCGRCGALLQTD